MKPRKRLRRSGKPIPRRVRPRAKGGSRFPKRRDRAYLVWIRTLRCAVLSRRVAPSLYVHELPCEGRIECAHVRSRGAGGNDHANCLPLCRAHHREQHQIGWKEFQFRHAIPNAVDAADELACVYPGPEGQRQQAGVV